MPVKSSPFECTAVSGEDAKAFQRKMRYGRGTKNAAASASNGRKLVALFCVQGVVPVELNAPRSSESLRTGAEK